MKMSNKCINDIYKYLPKVKSHFELVSNLNNDIKEILLNGCQYYPNLFCNKNDLDIFNQLLLYFNDNIIEWSHHYKIDNPENIPLFNEIIECLANYFNIKVLASRINYYTSKDFKPFHHDSHAYSNGIKEDITIGLSLGSSRILSLKHVETNNFFSFPQNNGDIFCFNHLTNQKFQHGIPKLKTNDESNIRISIILWGKIL
jgi:hypothetical protein